MLEVCDSWYVILETKIKSYIRAGSARSQEDGLEWWQRDIFWAASPAITSAPPVTSLCPGRPWRYRRRHCVFAIISWGWNKRSTKVIFLIWLMVHPPGAFKAHAWWWKSVRKPLASFNETQDRSDLSVVGGGKGAAFKSRTDRTVVWSGASVFDRVTGEESGVVKHVGWGVEMSLLILERARASALSLTPTQLSAAGSVTADGDFLPVPQHTRTQTLILIDNLVSNSLLKTNRTNQPVQRQGS